LWLFGFFVLVYSGVDSIKNSGDISAVGLRGTDASLSKSYLSGFLMSSGILLWDATMAAASGLFRKFLTVRVLKAISVLSGLSLIGFGFYFGVQAARLLFFH
jgi:L-lysine exporter family protein LysE/ArgO